MMLDPTASISAQFANSAQAKSVKPTSITGRVDLDFLLVGGLSVFVILSLYLIAPFQSNWVFERHSNAVSWTFLNLSLVCNYPHFMASYRFAYGQGSNFIRRYWLQLICIPAALFIIFGMFLALVLTPSFLAKILSLSPIAFRETLGNMDGKAIANVFSNVFLNLMFLTVGWHYAKQVYGLMLCQAKFTDYPLTRWQVQILKICCLSIWFVNLAFANSSIVLDRLFYDAHYDAFLFPEFVIQASVIFFCFSLAAFLVFILLRNYRSHRRIPPARFWIPLFALILWWVPMLPKTPEMNQMIPFFHSLQYLVFVHAIEKMRAEEASRSAEQAAFKYWAVVGTLVITGIIFFELLPNYLDNIFGVFPLAGFGMIFIFFTAFINIHHYFIDNVLWRRDGKLLKHYILKN